MISSNPSLYGTCNCTDVVCHFQIPIPKLHEPDQNQINDTVFMTFPSIDAHVLTLKQLNEMHFLKSSACTNTFYLVLHVQIVTE